MATGSNQRRRWLPRRTLRLRLTLLYGGLFLGAGVILLAITYALAAHSEATTANRSVVVATQRRSGNLPTPPFMPPGLSKSGGVFYRASPQNGGGPQLREYAGRVTAKFQKLTEAQQAQLRSLQDKANAQLKHQRQAQLNSLLTESGIALAIMAFVSIGLGWLMAGRALRPVRTMNARVRGISERNLDERLALEGPNDELKELGDTFDGLLARLEGAFQSQRQFVANASHELRTPVTLSRTLVEVALADPRASAQSLRATCERVLAAGEQQERLIESLLTLARSQRGLAAREELDLGVVVRDVLAEVPPNGVQVKSRLGLAPTWGDPALVERLAANLVDNALNYNEPHGWVSVWTGLRDGAPTLEVSNSGPMIAPEQAGELLEPFRRMNGDRASGQNRADSPRGLGLGLSIVDAIARAHGATLATLPRDRGGLTVRVRFPSHLSGGSIREVVEVS